MATVDLSYLLPSLRLYIGDTIPSSYRYTDEWLLVALQVSVKALESWWGDKYLLEDDTNLAYRNPDVTFDEDEPPVILHKDERPIVLMAAINTLEGSLENMSWSLASWKDQEISYTNLEQGKIKNQRIQRLWDELMYLLKPPTKRLAQTYKGHLPGYRGNAIENKDTLF